MKFRFALTVTMVSLLAIGASAQQAAPAPPAPAAAPAGTIDGNWSMNVTTDQGAMAVSLVLKSEGKKVTGTITSPQGEAPLEGEYADGKLAFGISIDTPEGAMQIGFAGTMKDDGSLAGMMSGPFGEVPWTATRAK
jgi:hypothetical protein